MANKISREELKTTILFVSKNNGSLKFRYLPIEDIGTTEKCYNLYYGGGREITIWRDYENHYSKMHHATITAENIDAIVDEVFDCLTSHIGDHISQALINIGEDGEYETLKYFDRDLALYERFRAEVARLAREN